jgi:hypothetical protein
MKVYVGLEVFLAILDLGGGGQIHTPAALPPRKEPSLPVQ